MLLLFFGVPILLWFLTPPIVQMIVGDDPATKGQFGDIFGSANALFSALAFGGLIYAMIVQIDQVKEMRMQQIQTEQQFAKQMVNEERRLRINKTLDVLDEWFREGRPEAIGHLVHVLQDYVPIEGTHDELDRQYGLMGHETPFHVEFTQLIRHLEKLAVLRTNHLIDEDLTFSSIGEDLDALADLIEVHPVLSQGNPDVAFCRAIKRVRVDLLDHIPRLP